jgi:hypothetical protein
LSGELSIVFAQHDQDLTEAKPVYMDVLTVVSPTKTPFLTFQLKWKTRSLGAIVVLTLSSLCPSLKHLVPDIGELQSLVIENVKPWAAPNSSLDAVISIIQDMQRKQRILACV